MRRLPAPLGLPVWSVFVPLAACGLLAASWGHNPGWLQLARVAGGLIAAVLVAVFHAEVVAHRIGESLGTLVLALAVTVIEVSLIVSMMRSGGGASALARATVLQGTVHLVLFAAFLFLAVIP